jgi:hypothetical protein
MRFFKIYKKHVILLSVFAFLLIMLSLLKGNEYISEYVFARGISRAYIKGVGTFTALLPFSVYEILIMAAFVYLIIVIIYIIKNLAGKNYQKALKRFMSFVAVMLAVVILYNVSASFAYKRQPLDLGLNREKPGSDIVFAAAQYFINDYNQIAENMERDDKGNIIPPCSFNELSLRLQAEFRKYDDGYMGEAARAKPMLFSEIMSYLGFSGVFMALTAEPNINVNVPPKELPLVCAHEMAHSAGIMKENEANLMSYYILLNSQDPYLRYSGYGAAFYQIMGAVYFACGQQKYNQLAQQISPLIYKENANSAQYWENYASFLNGITEFFNDLYLKLSGIKEGTASYENPYQADDTGEIDDDGNVIYEITYSDVQYMFFTIYEKNVNP